MKFFFISIIKGRKKKLNWLGNQVFLSLSLDILNIEC